MAHAHFYLVNVSPDEWRGDVLSAYSVIGRRAGVEIQLPSRYTRVSRRHASLTLEKSRFWLKDLGSRAGTRVNGVWLNAERPVEIRFGDRILLADVELLFQLEAPHEFCPQSGTDLDETTRRDEAAPAAVRESEVFECAIRSGLTNLTPAELDIVHWMRRGVTEDREIGRELHRSPHTVRTQIGSILRKLQLPSRIAILNLFHRQRSELHASKSHSDQSIVG